MITHKSLFLVSIFAIFQFFANAKEKCKLINNENDSLKTGEDYSKKYITSDIEPEKKCNSSASKNYLTCFHFGYNNRIINFKANVNGGNKEFDFVLDTGAPTFITDSVLNEYSPEFITYAEAYDINNNQHQVNSYRISSFNIYGKEFKNIEAANSSFVQNMAVLRGRANGGLIGSNIMKNSIWMINFKTKQIIITDNIGLLEIPYNAFITNMHTDANGSPVIDVNIGLKHKHSFIVDLAYNGSILLPEKYFNKPIFNDTLTYTKKELLSAGFATDIKQNSYYFIRKLDIGNLHLNNIKSFSSGKNTRSLIGNEFLENYIIVLDFIDKKFILIPFENDLKKPI